MSQSTVAFGLLFVCGCGATASDRPPSVELASLVVAPSGPVDNLALSTDQHDNACANSAAPSSVGACAVDRDCGLCHDGSACGTGEVATTLRARAAECARGDTADCESERVRCCDGHCRLVAF